MTHQTTPGEIDVALRGALLTEEELAAGSEEWLRHPDPARHDAIAANRKEDR
ncbi:hypothetical protein [Amycolatopsis mediterranei]|uniref:Uncharacterized protein n=1 Tax=Amycolatopsis mediterranei (strain S699) TaxID=713604 RepID=A0A9R0UAB8_AMYMS|nr:hypothetical protein RAM_25475 [Amycolatopsis mediterranei S699]